MKPRETFRLDRLYHQFLKPKGGTRDQLATLVEKLGSHGYIEVLQGRYSETEKMNTHENRRGLFKLIQGVVNEKI